MTDSGFKSFVDAYKEFTKEQDKLEKFKEKPKATAQSKKIKRPLAQEDREAIIRADRERRDEEMRKAELDKPFEIDGAL